MTKGSTNTENTNFQKYLDLIRGFLSKEITSSVFETRFLQLRREDSQWMKSFSDHKGYRILDTLFLDVDEYVPDELYDLRDQFNINELELRKRLSAHLILLEQILL
ncbi:hypothetical protein I6I99_19250 [Sphingobacterium multivorum]|nr:colicin immunity domain-containing protein [Sphingobacterium multivorum]QQT29463.1 hypothetical protein I6I99_19250 [Sphingobacterium multivorum]